MPELQQVLDLSCLTRRSAEAQNLFSDLSGDLSGERHDFCPACANVHFERHESGTADFFEERDKYIWRLF